MDCILIQGGKAHQIWPDTTKQALCFCLHEGETEPRAIFPVETVDAIVEVEAGTVVEGATWDGAHFTNPVAPEPSVPETISDRQFFQQLAIAGVISQAEALAAVKTGDMPASLAAIVAALPAQEQFDAEMKLSGAVEFHRSHPLTEAIRVASGWSIEQCDALWRAAAAL